MSQYHIRYGGYGGIGYYHVSDTYIALFSHFIPCGTYEGVYILDVLQKNESDIQPDTLHGDTHAQSYTVFGLSHLLGIKLMPAFAISTTCGSSGQTKTPNISTLTHCLAAASILSLFVNTCQICSG